MSSDERNEEPTAKRRQEFRDEGKVANSREVTAVVLGAVATAGFVMGGRALAQAGLELARRSWTRIGEQHERGVTITLEALEDGGNVAATMIAACGGTLVLAAVAIGLAQTGGLWAKKSIGFKLERIALFSGLKRAFASAETITQLLLTLAKAGAVGAVLWVILEDEVRRLPALVQTTREGALAHVGALLLRVTIAALLVTAVLAAIDWLLTHRKISQQMKMTKQEIKDEHKQQEGDPLVKQRIRSRMRAIGRNRMLAAVRKADVVVVNPTHYAVALSYRQGDRGAPRLVAKGVDHLAAKIREVARKHGVPIVANPPVARAIHATAKVGKEIPPELYEVVARVLAYVYRMTRWRNAA
ncbi:MAG TPA: flagellar type III secretion system protein FlhB [Nannocystaceae bacterium]|nr:flagellar type III secretion system protein FlhB [Nannocystaceae bacterium]